MHLVQETDMKKYSSNLDAYFIKVVIELIKRAYSIPKILLEKIPKPDSITKTFIETINKPYMSKSRWADAVLVTPKHHPEIIT